MLASVFSFITSIPDKANKNKRKKTPSPKSILKKHKNSNSPKTKKHKNSNSPKTKKQSVKISDTVDEMLYTPSNEEKCDINNGENISNICPTITDKNYSDTDFPCKKKTPDGNGYTIFNNKAEWEEYLWLKGKIKLENKQGKLGYYQGKIKNKGMKSTKNVIKTLKDKNQKKKKKDYSYFLESTDFKTYFEA